MCVFATSECKRRKPPTWKKLREKTPAKFDWRTNGCPVPQVESVTEYLRHPVKRFLPITQLPSLMRQQLMIARKYIFAAQEGCVNLASLGLLSFGVRDVKEKEHVSRGVMRLGHAQCASRVGCCGDGRCACWALSVCVCVCVTRRGGARSFTLELPQRRFRICCRSHCTCDL